ncbi:terminase, partial [Thioclava sp. BHET1]
IDDPRFWKMANPNLGVAFSEERFRSMLNEAKAIAGKMPNFRRLHLNLWTEGAQSWIEREVWDLGKEPFDPASLFGLPAWIGLDLSKTTDLTSICVAIPKDGKIYLLSYSFLPSGPKGFVSRAQKEKREYVAWRDQGWLEVHGGGVIDDDQIIERLEWIRAKFDVREVAYDRWGMKYMAKELQKRRFPLIEHGQGYASMSSPMKRFEQAVAKTRLRHNGNPVLAWAVGNVHRDEDAAENIKPNKAKSTNRIDPAVAAIMAVGRAEAAEGKRKRREIETV